MRTLGIDEAGRGAIIGPLVIVGFCAHDSLTEYLWSMGIKDSKQLSPKQRNEVYKKLKGWTEKVDEKRNHYLDVVKIIKIKPDEIDRAVLEHQLNWLEARYFAKIIEHFELEDIRMQVFVDSPDSIPIRFKDFINCYLVTSPIIEIISANHADENNVFVAAASIVAKITRDREIQKLHKLYGDLIFLIPPIPLKVPVSRRVSADISSFWVYYAR